jgi:hypothetical protein
MSPAPINPTLTNPWNQLLRDRAGQLAAAQRFALAPDCNPIDPADLTTTPAQQRAQIIEVPINAAIAGDNLLIQTLAGRKLIYELFLWNGSGAPLNWSLYQGSSLNGVLKLPMTAVPAGFGLFLGFNGSWEQPHFTIDQGQVFTLNISTAGPVQGLMRYKIDNGTG